MSTTTTPKGTKPVEPTPTSPNEEQQLLPIANTPLKEQENDKKRGAQESPENQTQRKNTKVETDTQEKEDEMEEDEDTEENKLDIAIAKAIKKAIDPLITKIDQIQNQIQAAVKEATLPLLKEISSLKGELEKWEKSVKTTKQPSLWSNLFDHNRPQPQHPATPNPSSNAGTTAQPSKDLLTAKRSLGFFPITQEDVTRNQLNKNQQNTPREHYFHAGRNVIKNFLARELKMPEEEIENLEFKDVFFPQSGSDAKTLYVEFHDHRNVKRIMSHAHKLNSNNHDGPKITQYIPKSLQPQYQALQTLAYNARKGTPKKSTKIWFADTLELRVRDIGDTTPWRDIKPMNDTPIPPKEPRVSQPPLGTRP